MHAERRDQKKGTSHISSTFRNRMRNVTPFFISREHGEHDR